MTSLKEALRGKLSNRELRFVPTSFDIIGDIAVFNHFPKELTRKEKFIMRILMKLNKNVKVVLKKTKPIAGKYRTAKLKIVSGEPRKETVHKENGCLFKLNVEKCYFSPRLSGERLRIAKLVKKGETILVLFSGVGVYPCVIAKNAEPSRIVGVELNKFAHRYAEQNVKLNKAENVTLIEGDAKTVLPTLKETFDRIVMPLPKDSPTYLDLAIKNIKPGGMIHLYIFAAESEFAGIIKRYQPVFSKVTLVKCGAYSPRVYRICLDLCA